MKARRWVAYGLGGLGALALVAAAAVGFLSQRALGEASDLPASRLAAPTPAQLADGPRQLRVMGCIGCHGEGLTGKLFFDEQHVGKVYAPNIVAIAATTDDATLDRALRRGVGHDGRALLVMPSEGYQFLTDQEAAALIAAIRALPNRGQQVPARSIGPLGRVGIATGKFRTVPDLLSEFHARPIPDLGPATAAGRHIVATNCAECHGPDLKGREVEPGVVSADLAVAGAYDLPQFTRLMRTGVPPSGKNLGLMREVAAGDFKYLTDREIAAVHAYLVANASH